MNLFLWTFTIQCSRCPHSGGNARTPWPVATLEVIGRKSGKPVRLPIIIADLEGERYLVSMLGEDTNWVRNVRAAEHRAVLLQRERTAVRLDEVPVAHPPRSNYQALLQGRHEWAGAHPGRPQRPNRSVRGHRHRLPGVPHRHPRPELRRGREQILRGQHGHGATIACPQVDPDRTPPRRGNASCRMHGDPDVRRSPAPAAPIYPARAPLRVGRRPGRRGGCTAPTTLALAGRCRASDACRMTFGRKIVGVAGTEAVVYGAWVRPRLVRWGATDEEVTGPYPGADLVPGGESGGAMAVTIDAPPDQVWPWLVQLGGDRGGWYSWDHLDNAGRPSARRVHPEWQDLALGDYEVLDTPPRPANRSITDGLVDRREHSSAECTLPVSEYAA